MINNKRVLLDFKFVTWASLCVKTCRAEIPRDSYALKVCEVEVVKLQTNDIESENGEQVYLTDKHCNQFHQIACLTLFWQRQLIYIFTRKDI